MATTAGTIINFYYKVEDILDEIMNDSLFLEDGGNEDYDTASVDQTKLVVLKKWLKETANDVFVMLHKGSSIVEITADELAENNATEVFTWDAPIYGQEGNYISYWSKFATEFDTNLMNPVDSAIQRALIDITLFKWLKRKGRLTQQIIDNKDEARSNVLRLINYRAESKKTYRMY
jgi:hypothetical protein